MTLSGKYIYVYFDKALSVTCAGLMDGPSKEYVCRQIERNNRNAVAIYVNKASDSRPAMPVMYDECKEECRYIFAYIDIATGSIASGIRDSCGYFHDEIVREMIQHYCPGATGIIVQNLKDDAPYMEHFNRRKSYETAHIE